MSRRAAPISNEAASSRPPLAPLLAVALALLVGCSSVGGDCNVAGAPPGSPGAARSDPIIGSVHLRGDRVVVPFVLIDDWIFLDGEMNDTKGMWMFDTGAREAISVHAGKVGQDNGEVVGSGFVGSGLD